MTSSICTFTQVMELCTLCASVYCVSLEITFAHYFIFLGQNILCEICDFRYLFLFFCRIGASSILFGSVWINTECHRWESEPMRGQDCSELAKGRCVPVTGLLLTFAFTAISHKAHAHGIECNINFKIKATFYLKHLTFKY